MKCDSINIISSLPFAYHLHQYSFPQSVLDEYIKIYRKELNVDRVIDFLTYERSSSRVWVYDRMEYRMEYLMKIYDLEIDHIFNLDMTPDHIIRLYNSYYMRDNISFLKHLHQLTGKEDIFCGDDINSNINLLSCRSFTIFQTLY